MKGLFRAGPLILCLILVVIPGAAGWEVRDCTIAPEGNLASGTPVEISVAVVFPAIDAETFPGLSDLSLSTDLTDTVWKYSLIIDGTTYTLPAEHGRYQTLDGTKLSYPAGREETLVLHLNGKAPAVTQPMEIRAIRIEEIDNNNCNCISNSKPFERNVRVYDARNTAGTAASWTVTNVSIDPSGSLTPGEQVIALVRIDFQELPAVRGSRQLRMVTELEKPKWTKNYILDGYEKPRTAYGGNQLILDEYYGSGIPEVYVNLWGMAPDASRASNATIVRVEELDEKGNVVASAPVFVYNSLVVTIAEPGPALINPQAGLDTLRVHIAEKAALSINTTGAEEKYNQAKKKLGAASAVPESHAALAFNKTTSALEDIAEGERLLDKAWAEKEVADAQEKVDQADAIIAWFKGNRSTAEYYRVNSFISDRDDAAKNISSATADIQNGNYSLARSKAQVAFLKANESFNNATSSQRIIVDSNCGFCFQSPFVRHHPLLIPGVIGSIVLLIGGIFWWMKRGK